MNRTTRKIFCLVWLWSFAFWYLPGPVSQASAADRLVTGSLSAVYYLDEAGNRHVFMNEKVYYSWYADFSQVRRISDAALAGYPLAGVVTYRPGVKLVKIQSDPKVYAVAAGGELRWVKTEALARELYGADWNALIDDVEPGFFASFLRGPDIEATGDYDRAAVLAAAPDIQANIQARADKRAAASAVTFNLNLSANRTAISPYIYGTNIWPSNVENDVYSFYRLGGNRYSAYNWEINASNAGTDWNNSSDRWLSYDDNQALETLPGEHMKEGIARARARGAATLITVPMLDYVVADANGSVSGSAISDPSRWVANNTNKTGALLMSPDLTDGVVYQEEFVNFMQQTYPDAQTGNYPIFYSLDNEPALWPDTHPLAHPGKTDYAELLAKTTQTAGMIKELAPAATVFGPALYGYYSYLTLQDAPDANGRDFIDFYLQGLQQYENTQRTRLVDVLDLHWYPEAHDANYARVTDTSPSPSSSLIEARVQAPRSLWDPTYQENSWIANVVGGPIALLPKLRAQINANYPGTKLAMSEYNYGGGGHISGGLAQADVLGIFGREGLYAATLWPLSENTVYQDGAFRMFHNFDGQGARVGDYSVPANTTDIQTTSVYAFGNSSGSGALQVIAINKTDQALSVEMKGVSGFLRARAYRLQQGAGSPRYTETVSVSGSSVTVVLPAYSVTTYQFE
ncbi:glycoside hydrolase family 44 protein [Patescibacteria group bacterium]|nr:glycoside hydrolase family 44 protein [Patescibacteria group bacterium]MBU1705432.1 glycoside hydrolase family 44 protein [Patescibacteria group bacterium]